jgi:CheY-like chemotaxis protein
MKEEAIFCELPKFSRTPQTITILLVDDEEAIRTITRQVLESFGYRVLEAQAGETALGIYVNHKDEIDLVILDLNMPGMSGQVCLQKLLEIEQGVKVLVASGYFDKGMENTVLAQGASGFLQKPFTLNNLMERVQGLLKQ